MYGVSIGVLKQQKRGAAISDCAQLGKYVVA